VIARTPVLFITLVVWIAAAACAADAQQTRPASAPSTAATTRAADAGNAPARPDAATILQQTRELALYPLGRRPTGTVRIDGSKILTHILHACSEAYTRLQPGVTVQIKGTGSAAGFTSLIAGQTDFAALSRDATAEEMAAFHAKFGRDPASILAGVGAVAIYVNKDNPLRELSIADVDAIYSRVPAHGSRGVDKWGDLGLTGAWADAVPVRFGPQSGHGDFDLFRSVVLLDGRLRLDIREEAFTSSLVQGVGAERTAIGYASIVYQTRAVRALAISRSPTGQGARPIDKTAYTPTRENVLSGKYPLARPLRLYFNKDPRKPLPEALLDFGMFVTSQIGQQTCGDAGMMPIDAKRQAESIEALQ
jgi:phosphate transport system substrate-binding protein